MLRMVKRQLLFPALILLLAAIVRAAFLDTNPNQDSIKGARDYEALFKTISEADDTGQPLPGPGLNYMADVMPPKPVE